MGANIVLIKTVGVSVHTTNTLNSPKILNILKSFLLEVLKPT